MKLNFTKMHGCGNDYIYVNGFETVLENPPAVARALSRRHFSVGSDGLILVCPSETADICMKMYNADGSVGKMCGNGIRCAARFAYDKGICLNNPITVETPAGIKTVQLFMEENTVTSATVNMGRAQFEPEAIPITGNTPLIGQSVRLGSAIRTVTCVSMGNPHCVIFEDAGFDLWHFPIEETGQAIETDPLFPEKTNVEFVKKISDSHFEMRVWERGSGETFACGTGACATVAAAVKNGLCGSGEPITVTLKGGDLTVTYTETAVTLTGEAVYAFEGTVQL